MSDEVRYPQFASRGRAYVYVLPCRDEDLLKLGFSRDPFTRFHTLHRRFYEFFDLEDDVEAFTSPLPRVRVIPIERFDPWTLLA